MKKLIFIVLLLSGCMVKQPVKAPEENQKCFQFRQCLYLLQKSKDKSICQSILSECSKLDTYEFCKNPGKREKNQDFNTCWHILK